MRLWSRMSVRLLRPPDAPLTIRYTIDPSTGKMITTSSQVITAVVDRIFRRLMMSATHAIQMIRTPIVRIHQ